MALLLALLWAMPVCAQTDVDPITQILLDENMISGHGEGEDEQEAYQLALQELTEAVSEYRIGNGKSEVSSSDLQTQAKMLTGAGGREVLLYLTVKQALALVPREQSSNTPVAVGGHGQQPAQQPQQPAQQPHQPAQQPQQPVQQPQQPAQQPAASSHNAEGAEEVAETLAAFANTNPLQFDELMRLLGHQKNNAKISDFGKAGADRVVPDGSFVVIVGRDFQVKSILSPRNAVSRKNYITNTSDNESNYHDYGIIWFK